MEGYILDLNTMRHYHKIAEFEGDKYYFMIITEKEIEALQKQFKFSNEAIEACLRKDESVRMQSFDGYDYISFKYFSWNKDKLDTVDINLFTSKNFIIVVVEEAPHLTFEIKQYVLKKLNHNIIPHKSLSKLYFGIWDWILLHYTDTLQRVEESIEELEGHIDIETHNILEKINYYRKTVRKLKKYLRPLLYIGDELIVNDNETIHSEMMKYFKNVDIRINKTFDFCNDLVEMVDQLSAIYDSKQSAKTTQVATNITVLAAFLTPMTIITGLYGMNFDFMPELHWHFGYPFAISLMLLTSIIIYLWLRRKKWFT